MHLIEDRIQNYFPLQEKKVTKLKTNSIRDMFKYFCKPYLKNGYVLKKDTLYRPTEETKQMLNSNLNIELDRFKKLKKLQEENKYSNKLQEDINKCSDKLKKIREELQEVEYDFAINKRILSYKEYKEIILLNNKYITDEIINGKTFIVSFQVGFIEGRYIERNHKNRKVDFGKTNKRKKELLASGVKEEELYHKDNNPNGIKYISYFIDDDYATIAWNKGALRNISVYSFKPSTSNSTKGGFKNRFSIAQKNNPSLKRKYPKIIYSKDDI
jgi:DNA gyrase/topoisomerase IV subunit A